MKYRSRLRAADIVGEGSLGARTRRGRTALSALGVAIGVAALVAVVGISSSSRADLLAQLDRLGTNLLTVLPGRSIGGDAVPLSHLATGMIGRIPPVGSVSAVGVVDNVTVRRTQAVPAFESGGISVQAVDLNLLSTLDGSVAEGTFLNAASAHYPAVVLGAVAARHLGIDDLRQVRQVWLGEQYFTVVGVLAPLPLEPEIDRAALIGWPLAETLFGSGGNPSEIYLRAAPEQVAAVQAVLARTVNPEYPSQVTVSRPSDALAARAATDQTLTTLLLGLGAVALLVGGIGIANIMFVAVLERRVEVGLRRALGATRGHIAIQFVAEAAIVCGLGGLVGVAVGSGVTAFFARSQGWTPDIPAAAPLGGFVVAVAVGVVAGLYPAIRASRVAPSEALRSI